VPAAENNYQLTTGTSAAAAERAMQHRATLTRRDGLAISKPVKRLLGEIACHDHH
jgi:hypothetical protein